MKKYSVSRETITLYFYIRTETEGFEPSYRRNYR